MDHQTGGVAVPVSEKERIGELDVLRGFALLGVLIANITGWALSPFWSTDAQNAALASAEIDETARFFDSWLVEDKANTLFATLFGIGFWVQMKRLEARGGDFQRVYLRRITILLLIGCIHLFVLWPWDIVSLYALTAFLLFALRGSSDRVLVVLGLSLALAGRPLVEFLIDRLGISSGAYDRVYSDAAILARQAASDTGNPVEVVVQNAWLTWNDWIVSGLFLAWVAYCLGRFLLGAYIARKGWIERAPELLGSFRKVLAIALPLGLAGEFIAMQIDFAYIPAPEWLFDVLHFPSVLLFDVGYVCLIVVLFNSAATRSVTGLFAPVGRMALSNYVLQSVFISFVLYGFGLGLAGKIGTASLVLAGLGFFAVQTAVSYLWLKRFRFGPLEYLWRWGTYGKRPALRAYSA